MPTSARIDLLSNGSATSSEVAWPGGEGAFTVKANWGGGAVSLQYQLPDGATWEDVSDDAKFIGDGGCLINLPGCTVRAYVSGTATAIYARLSGTGD